MPWLSKPQAAKYAGVCRETIDEWQANGLVGYRLSERVAKFDTADIDEFIKRHPVENEFSIDVKKLVKGLT